MGAEIECSTGRPNKQTELLRLVDGMPAKLATRCGPRLSRRAAQGRTEKEAHMFESRTRGEFVGFPAEPSSAEKSALGRPAKWGRLFFGDFLLAKQKKVTAPPGAHPGNGRQAASPRRGEKNTKQFMPPHSDPS
jgi:hypothetical protein